MSAAREPRLPPLVGWAWCTLVCRPLCARHVRAITLPQLLSQSERCRVDGAQEHGTRCVSLLRCARGGVAGRGPAGQCGGPHVVVAQGGAGTAGGRVAGVAMHGRVRRVGPQVCVSDEDASSGDDDENPTTLSRAPVAAVAISRRVSAPVVPAQRRSAPTAAVRPPPSAASPPEVPAPTSATAPSAGTARAAADAAPSQPARPAVQRRSTLMASGGACVALRGGAPWARWSISERGCASAAFADEDPDIALAAALSDVIYED